MTFREAMAIAAKDSGCPDWFIDTIMLPIADEIAPQGGADSNAMIVSGSEHEVIRMLSRFLQGKESSSVLENLWDQFRVKPEAQ